MHSNYVRLPPDSTGKKVQINPLWIIPVADASLYAEDDVLVGGTSGTIMKVKQINTSQDYIYAKYTSELQEGTSWTVGENILVNDSIIGTVLSTPFVNYVNVTSLVSHDNPFHGQRVDAAGQAYFRFEEGAQILDSLGRSKVVEDRPIGTYKFTNLVCWDKFLQTTVVGTASKTMDAYNFALKLSSGTANGDSIRLMSHKYHMHVAGAGLLCTILMSLGDSGKTNLSREWGYCDEDNGIFFDLMGTELNLVVRNSSSGTPVDLHYPQSEWNRDKLDGAGVSQVILDVTKVNKYWFDFNRGVRFRAGIYGPDGTRIVCHDVKIANNASQLLLPSTNLPVRILQKNVGTVISTSEMTFIEATVMLEGDADLHTHPFEAGGNSVNVTSAAWVPLVSLRPQTNSKHTLALLVDVAVSAVLAADANADGRIKLEIYRNPTLTGATFDTIKTDSMFEVDKAATAMSGGEAIIEYFIKGTKSEDVEKHFSYLDEYLVQEIDGDKPVYTLAAKAIAADCTVVGAINWKEYLSR